MSAMASPRPRYSGRIEVASSTTLPSFSTNGIAPKSTPSAVATNAPAASSTAIENDRSSSRGASRAMTESCSSSGELSVEVWSLKYKPDEEGGPL